MVMYRAGEGPKPTTAPKPVPRAGPSPLPSPGPKSHEGTDAIPMDYFDKACMSPSPDSITEDLGRCLGTDCLCRACCRALAGLPPVDPDITAEEKALEEATREARAARLSHHSENFEAGVAAAAESMREAAAAEAARLEREAQEAMADSVCLDEEDTDNDDISVTLDYTINLDEETLALDDDVRATTVPSHQPNTKRSSKNRRRSSSKSSGSAEGGHDCSIDDDDDDNDNDSVGSHSSTSSAPTVSGNKKVRPRRSVRRATRHSARPAASRPSSKAATKRNNTGGAPRDGEVATAIEAPEDTSDGDCAVDGRRCSGSGNEFELLDDDSSYSPNKQLFSDPVQSTPAAYGLAPLVETDNEHPTPAKANGAAEARSALCQALNSATDASGNNGGCKEDGTSAANSAASGTSPRQPPTAVPPPPSPANGMRPKPSHPSSYSSGVSSSSLRRSLPGRPMGTSMDSVLGSSASSGSSAKNSDNHGSISGSSNKSDGLGANAVSRAPSPLVRVVYSVALSPDPKDTSSTTTGAGKESTDANASYNVTLDDDENYDDSNVYGDGGYEAPDASDSLLKSPVTKARSGQGSSSSSGSGSSNSNSNSIISNNFGRHSVVGSVSTAQARKSLVQQRKDLDTRRQLRLAGGTSLDSVLGSSSSSSSSSMTMTAKSPAFKPKPSTHLQRSPAALSKMNPSSGLSSTGGRRSAPACLTTEPEVKGESQPGESNDASQEGQQLQQQKEDGWVPIVTLPAAGEESPPCLIPEERPPKDSVDLVATTTSTATTSATSVAAAASAGNSSAAAPRRPAPSRPRPRTAPLLETHKFFNSPDDEQVPANTESGSGSSNSVEGRSSGNNGNTFVSISKQEQTSEGSKATTDSAPIPPEPRPPRLLSPDSVMFDDEEGDNFDESNITAAK